MNKSRHAEFDFSGQVALVTGGARGIGASVCRQLTDLGARVFVADIDADHARAMVADLPKGSATHIAFDVSDASQVEASISEVVASAGKLDILVHCAGIGVERSFLETTPEEWRRLVDVDLSGTFYCAQSAARHMASQEYGRIVLLSSTAGLRGGTGRAAYGAAKGGVIALTKVMAVELARYGITANALAPGAIETELVARMHSDRTRQVYRSRIPQDRYGSPDETAFAAVFLASEQASYVNGQILGVDGGFLAAGVMA